MDVSWWPLPINSGQDSLEKGGGWIIGQEIDNDDHDNDMNIEVEWSSIHHTSTQDKQ